VSVLLREPYGFEGLSAIQVRAPLDHFAVMQRQYMAHRGIDVYTAAASRASVSREHKDTIATHLDELLRYRLEVVEGRMHLANRAQHPFAAVIAALATTDLVRLVPDDFGIKDVEFGPSAAVEPLVEPPHDLHVLLRHRPRSIPQAQESA
jgi:hypothetical protein